jgi:predicted metal-dependent peptidase
VFDYVRTKMREKPDLLLYFTDGYGTAPDRQPGYPVMWVLTKDGRPPCGWGRVMHFKKTTE